MLKLKIQNAINSNDVIAIWLSLINLYFYIYLHAVIGLVLVAFI